MQGLKIFNQYIYNIYSDDFIVKKNAYENIYKPYINFVKENIFGIKKENSSFKIKKEFVFNPKLILKKTIMGIKI